MWAFVGLAMIELMAVHLFVALKWHWLAWPLSAVTLLSIVWLVRLIRSFRTRPHELNGDRLHLHIGSLRSIDVLLGNIAGVRPVSDSAELKAPGTAKFSLLSYPNRIVDLRQPITFWRRSTRRIALALDDPAAFDLALRS